MILIQEGPADLCSLAAALCKELGLKPRALSSGEGLRELQLRLDRIGQFLPDREVHQQDSYSSEARRRSGRLTALLLVLTLPCHAIELKLGSLFTNHMVLQWDQAVPVRGREMPFVIVQIAPHESVTPAFRESQFRIWQKTPHTALVVTTDVGNAKDIHPIRKRPVGERLALAARAISYREKVEYSAPEVQKPTLVHYGNEKVPIVNLYNKAGLPAVPFRSDMAVD